MDSIREVMVSEAQGIMDAAARLDRTALTAVEWLANPSVTVALTGAGKAGFVARKVAATMVSLSKPAFFLHPTDALHGDLGLLKQGDVVLAFSNSGETEELIDLLPHLRRRKARVVTITSDAASRLAVMADLAIAYGHVAEACALGLAPTTSTAVMAALGDALAVAVSQRCGVTAQDFRRHHPGGSLGRALLEVETIMRTGERCPTTQPETSVARAVELVSAARVGLLSVVDAKGRLLGVFTDGDFRRAWMKDPNVAQRPVGEVMTRNPVSVSRSMTVGACLKLMSDRHINCIPVVDDHHRVLGMVDIQDAS